MAEALFWEFSAQTLHTSSKYLRRITFFLLNINVLYLNGCALRMENHKRQPKKGDAMLALYNSWYETDLSYGVFGDALSCSFSHMMKRRCIVCLFENMENLQIDNEKGVSTVYTIKTGTWPSQPNYTNANLQSTQTNQRIVITWKG